MSNVRRPVNYGSSLAPIARLAPIVRNGQDRHRIPEYLEHHRIREMPKHTSARAVFVHAPSGRSISESVNCVQSFNAKCIRRSRAPSSVPLEGLCNVVLGLWRKNDRELTHKAVSRALASAHGTAVVAPERSCSLRSRISFAQAFATVASSSPSRLSSKATTSAERSSGSRESASSRMWSTRAFMRGSLSGVQRRPRSSNPSIERTSQRPLRALWPAAHVKR